MQYSRYRVPSASDRGSASGQRLHSTGNQSGHNRCHGYRYSRQNRTSHDPRHAHERGPERPDNSWDTL